MTCRGADDRQYSRLTASNMSLGDVWMCKVTEVIVIVLLWRGREVPRRERCRNLCELLSAVTAGWGDQCTVWLYAARRGHRSGSLACVTHQLKWVSVRVLVGLMMTREPAAVLQVPPSRRLLVCHHWAAARTPALVSTTATCSATDHTLTSDKTNCYHI